ncbi:MAG: glycosyltransferase family 2 protein [Pseudoflavonifractor sp.]|nr:glycosyltransferase family 2 protein [Alloprevotella sp.]MCM1116091.1 glycosyltransferase family 2 protein [Pseudoflavonifractor sp.]
MLTTASIVTYHTPLDELDACLASLAEAGHVWVVDNASSPATEEHCRSIGNPHISYIPSKNDGYGAGHNQAIARALEAGTQFHLVVNSDVAFAPEMLPRAIGIMKSHGDIGLLHPRLHFPSGEEQYTMRLIPTPADLLLHRFIPRRWARRRMDRYELRRHPRTQELLGAAPYFQGSFMLFSAKALEDLRRRDGYYFDERFFMYPEDIDISRRVATLGLSLAYEPSIEAIHAHRAASRHPGKMLWIHALNMARYFNKWGWVIDPGRKSLNTQTLSRI